MSCDPFIHLSCGTNGISNLSFFSGWKIIYKLTFFLSLVISDFWPCSSVSGKYMQEACCKKHVNANLDMLVQLNHSFKGRILLTDLGIEIGIIWISCNFYFGIILLKFLIFFNWWELGPTITYALKLQL